MYTSHLAVFRRTLLQEIGGFRAGFEGSQDYDLVLRVTEKTDKIFHIPEVLYHWRVHAGSVTSGAQAKPYAYEAAIKALNEAMARRDEGGRIEHLGEDRGNYVVRYDIRRPGKVSVIIPTRDLAADVQLCVESIFARTTYPDYEIIILDNGSVKPETMRLFERFERTDPERFRVVRHDVPFNYSEINNYAAAQARGDYFLFLNNDTEVLTDDWMTLMVEQAQRDSIGAVGAKLLYADGLVQHAGVIIGIGGIAGHAFRHFEASADGYYNFLRTANNYSAVTAACLMMRRAVFEQVGGFDEELAIAYNDVDLCLRVGQAGYRVIYLPYVELRHYESKSRGYDTTAEQENRDQHERLIMQRKWNISNYVDPYYNPNLTLEREDFSIAP
jgi:GT2 family glycosyltransferase